ncbi:SLOG family protein [[Kitasatospora] papulosa]|uniref:SLOG family protein n=1 Tax=[Kitasatospora] papulosa TaxID=1464011 RepID=UPI003675F756
MTEQPTFVRVLITGSRTWDQVETIDDALVDTWHDTTEAHGFNAHLVVVHGACPRGADAHAAYWAARQDPKHVTAEAHPADWEAHGRGAGFRRNADMVRLGAAVCLAFIRDGSRGATHTAALAEKAGIPTRRFTA